MRAALLSLLLVASCDEITCNNKPSVSISGYTSLDHVRVEIGIPDHSVAPEKLLVQVPLFIPMPYPIKPAPPVTAEKP